MREIHTLDVFKSQLCLELLRLLVCKKELQFSRGCPKSR